MQVNDEMVAVIEYIIAQAQTDYTPMVVLSGLAMGALFLLLVGAMYLLKKDHENLAAGVPQFMVAGVLKWGMMATQRIPGTWDDDLLADFIDSIGWQMVESEDGVRFEPKLTDLDAQSAKKFYRWSTGVYANYPEPKRYADGRADLG